MRFLVEKGNYLNARIIGPIEKLIDGAASDFCILFQNFNVFLQLIQSALHRIQSSIHGVEPAVHRIQSAVYGIQPAIH